LTTKEEHNNEYIFGPNNFIYLSITATINTANRTFNNDMKKIVWSSSIDSVCLYGLTKNKNEQLLAPDDQLFYSENSGA
jgi:hypothetical protein